MLLVVPNGVVKNWGQELNKWGHFSIYTYDNSNRETILKHCLIGMTEILVISKSLLRMEGHFNYISRVDWKLIIIDEFHEYRNKKNGYEYIRDLKKGDHCPVIGLTGTMMPNAYSELYNLIDLIRPNLFGNERDFKAISTSILKSR